MRLIYKTTMKWVWLVMLIAACTNAPEGTNNPISFEGEWNIPKEKVFSGGPGIDGIPALSDPTFTTASEATYLEETDLIIGYKSGGEIKAYPHKILDWHEIANDAVNEDLVAITYCPLTGTAIGWNRNIDGEPTTFGVSGLLYNSNLIPYDRSTGSAWSQMLLTSVNGQLQGREISTFNLVETTWSTWKEMYPDTKVMSLETGHSRNYGSYPYINSSGDDYRTDPFLIFPVDKDDPRLPKKERVLGLIIGENTKIYRFSSFDNNNGVIHDRVFSTPVVIAGSTKRNFMVAFNSIVDDSVELSFTAIDEGSDIIMEDNEGNQWDIFGKAISGPRAGQKLTPVQSYIGYWFAWATFYQNLEIYQQ